jgi:predicted transcriptional regulator
MDMEYVDAILLTLKEKDEIHSIELQRELGLTYEALYSELVSLVPENYITLEPKKHNKLVLTPEGELYATEGTPEAKIFQMATPEGVPK